MQLKQPPFGHGRFLYVRECRLILALGKFSTRVMPSVTSDTYSPGPAIIIIVSPGKKRYSWSSKRFIG